MKTTRSSLQRRLALSLLGIAAIAGASCMAETRKDGSPEAGQEQPMASPPAEGDDFFEFGELPSGPAPVDGYDPDLIGVKDPTPAAQQPQGATDEAPTTQISRASVVDFVKNGPRHPLSLVEVQPAFTGNQFVGYRVTALSVEGAQHFGSSLRAGDVVLTVNERNIAMPEDYMAVWGELPKASKLSVSLIRDGQTIDMSWPIVD